MPKILMQLINTINKAGIAKLQISLFDKEGILKAEIGKTFSDEKGNFEFKIDDNDSQIFSPFLVPLGTNILYIKLKK